MTSKFLKPIAGLRALSVLSVFLYHLDERLMRSGLFGVDFFFVISGYVVTMSMHGHRDESLVRFIVQFYRRRILRIFPAVWLLVLVTMFVSALLIPKGFILTSSNKVGLAALAGVSNIQLYLADGSYFAPTTAYNFFTHTWSLGVEEQFYFIYPPLAFAILRGGRARKYGLVALGLLALGSLAASGYWSVSNPKFAFYMIMSRFWELAAGALLHELDPPARRVAGTAPWSVAVALAILASFALTPAGAMPFPAALLPVASALAAIHTTVHFPRSLLARALSWRPLVYIGNISYSLYLWHWFFITLWRWIFGLGGGADYAVIFAATLAAAALSYHLVENPVRRAPLILRQPHRRVFTAGAAMAGGMAGTCYAMVATSAHFTLSQTGDRRVWYPYLNDSEGRPQTACRLDYQRHAQWYGSAFVITPVDCPGPRRPGIVVYGDSHSGAYAHMMYRLAAAENRRIEVHENEAGLGCNWFRFTLFGQPHSATCLARMPAFLADLRQRMHPGDVLFLPALRVLRYRDIGESTILETRNLPPTAGFAAADRADLALRIADLRAFEDKGVRVVIETPTPVFKSAPSFCADWYLKAKPYCRDLGDISRAELHTRAAYATALIGQVRTALPRTELFDAFDSLCPGDPCSPFHDGKPLFFDGDHLSGYAGDVLLPHFEQMLASRAAAPSAAVAISAGPRSAGFLPANPRDDTKSRKRT